MNVELPKIDLRNIEIKKNKLSIYSNNIKMQPFNDFKEESILTIIGWQINWISLFLWQTFKEINSADLKNIQIIQELSLKESEVLSKLKNLKFSKRFKEIENKIEDLQEINEEILEEIQIKIGNIVQMDKIENLIETKEIDKISKEILELKKNILELKQEIIEIKLYTRKLHNKLFENDPI